MKIKTFFEEQKKITWPSFGKLISNVMIVVVFTAVMGVLFWLLDVGILALGSHLL